MKQTTYQVIVITPSLKSCVRINTLQLVPRLPSLFPSSCFPCSDFVLPYPLPSFTCLSSFFISCTFISLPSITTLSFFSLSPFSISYLCSDPSPSISPACCYPDSQTSPLSQPGKPPARPTLLPSLPQAHHTIPSHHNHVTP